MEETGFVRFPGNLDPRAQEFRPRHTNLRDFTQELTPFVPPPLPPSQLVHQVYYPYTPQAVPLCDFVGFTQYHHHVPPVYDSVGPSLSLPPTGAPTRTLVLSLVPTEVSETLVRRELEVFGEVRGVQMERLGDGMVTVHFYDLRHAERALREIREQHMQHQATLRNLFIQNRESLSMNIAPPPPARGLIAGCVVWAQFILPSCKAVPDGQNQGTLVVFNLDPNVSTRCLKEIFQAFGAVKELRETPLKRHQKFVEFYDVRDAAMALREMNGKEIYGKQVDIEFSRPGGYGKKFFNASTTISKNSSISTPCINSTASLNRSKTSTHVSPPSPPLLHRFSSGCSSPNISPRSFLPETLSSAGKKPSGNPGIGNPNEASNEAASSGCLSLGGGAAGDGIVDKVTDHGPPKKSSKKSLHSQSFTATKQQQKSAKSWKGTRQARKFDNRFLISDDSMVETSGSDSRTTVMIKNIPNKYSQKLLLNMLDNHCIHCNEQIADGDDQPLSSYDFLYLPIDFNNKCNVGYGFVNMTSPPAAWRLYKAFHDQHWEVFNSRKICAVTYARVQGLEALKEHFKNSKFPCEMDHYLPVVFSPPRDGRQQTEPLPIIGLKQLQQPVNVTLGHPITCAARSEIESSSSIEDSLKICNELHGNTDREGENQVQCSGSVSRNGGDGGDDDKDSK
ncbi:RNA BINDING PROTEIN [Salix koriyanagi]|uniref:RNA BINDING PROTEIN n=1 Tax=Salix koriyanagi TaxID=2511006 RepID=A0A9Q1AHC8_9ROSI|nr:RNA BINDING PROTEIN [Salix koriyanagi]